MKHTKKIHFQTGEKIKCNAYTTRNIRLASDGEAVTCERCLAQIDGKMNKRLWTRHLNKNLKELEQYISMSRG